MVTPELLARAVVAESDWRECTLATGELDFDKLRAYIVSALQSYGDERAREMRERCAQASDQVAADWGGSLNRLWFQDLAARIRALPID